MPPLHVAAAAMGRRGCGAIRRSTLVNIRTTNATAIVSANNASRYHTNVGLTHHLSISTQQITARCLSSFPPSSPASTAPSSISQSNDVTTNLTTDDESNDKSIFSKLWDKYSMEGQQKRIVLGERLFRTAQHRASDPRWFTEGRIPYEFRPRHALLTMHIWFLHKRLLADRVDSHLALLVQEELFDILWNDTQVRIRAEGVNELTVNKHLKDAQQLTFLQCTHMDHCFQEFANDDKKRFEELAGVNWTYILNSDEEVLNDQVKRLTMYIEYELENLLEGVPDKYFWQGRIPWGEIPEFKNMKDNKGNRLKKLGHVQGLEVLPKPWVKMLTNAGVAYYWDTDTNKTTWKKPE